MDNHRNNKGFMSPLPEGCGNAAFQGRMTVDRQAYVVTAWWVRDTTGKPVLSLTVRRDKRRKKPRKDESP